MPKTTKEAKKEEATQEEEKEEEEEEEEHGTAAAADGEGGKKKSKNPAREFSIILGGISIAIIYILIRRRILSAQQQDNNNLLRRRSTSDGAKSKPAEPKDVNDMVDEVAGHVFDPQKPNAWQIISSIFTTQMVIEEIMEAGLEKLIQKLHKRLTGKAIKEMPGVTTVLKLTYRTMKAAPKAFYTLFAKPSAAIAGAGVRLSKMGATLAGAGLRLYAQTAAMVTKLFTTSLVTKLAAMKVRLMLGAALGPIMWAIQIVSTAGMIVDFYDPHKENDRLDFEDINERAAFSEMRNAFLTRLNGQAWPPIASIQRLFPEEHEQAMQAVLEVYKNKAIDFVLHNPERDDGLTAFVLQLALGIPDKAINEALASNSAATRSMGASNTEELRERFFATIAEMMEKSPEFKDSVFYSSLVRKITENGVRDQENARRAPFWYFAMSIPTSFYTGTLDVDDIPPMKRGITYNSLTVMDVRVTSEKEQFGKKFIDIFRAKSPYFEERVRAYRVEASDIHEPDLAEAAIPKMPDIGAIAAEGTATYRRYERTKFEDNMIFQLLSNIGTDEAKAVGPKMHDHEKKFGFRDEPASKLYGRARGGAHSRWLAMCCFQQFLLELAQHPGVLMETKTATGDFDTVERVRGVFQWKDKYYRAFPPRPWHEPRFVEADIRFSRSEGNTTAVYLTEAACFRWNEVFEHQQVAGTVLSDLRGVPADETPNVPVAVWSDTYSDVDMDARNGRTPTPPQTRLLSSMSRVVDMYKRNGRVVFVRRAESLIVRVIKHSDFTAIVAAAKANGMSESDISRDFGRIFGTPDDVVLGNLAVKEGFDPTSAEVLLKIDVGGEAYVICNRNYAGQNTWRRRTSKVFERAGDVKAWPNMREARKDAMDDKDFKRRMRNVKSAVFFSNAKLSGKMVGGIFDVEVEVVASVTEKVWAHPRGKPEDVESVAELRLGEPAELGVHTYAVKVKNKDKNDKEEVCYFVNHDGSLDNQWAPVEVRRKLAGKRMLFLPVQQAYLYGTKGMENDDTMMRGTSKDDELAKKCGIYENYIVTNKSGVPHAMLEKTESKFRCDRISGPAISLADVYDRDAFDGSYIRLAFSTFHDGRVVIVSKYRDKADTFCRAYMGERYRKIEDAGRNAHDDAIEYGRCKPPVYQKNWEFVLGSTITKALERTFV